MTASPIATQKTEITSAIKRLREVAPQQPADPRLHWLAPVYVQPLDVRIVLEALSSAERRNEELVRERLAAWMIQHSIATGHGDTFEGLLGELSAYVRKMQADRAPSHSSHRILADAVVSRDERIASLTGQVGEMRERAADRARFYGAGYMGINPGVVAAFDQLAADIRALAPSPPGVSTTGGDGEGFVEMNGYSSDPVKLRRLLQGRDHFIVDRGLWSDFVDTLPRPPAEPE